MTIVVRAASLAHGMSDYLDRAARGAVDNIGYRLETVVDEAHGNGHLEAVTLRHVGTGATERMRHQPRVRLHRRPAAHRLARRDARPRRPRGFLLTGPDLVVDGRRPRGWQLDRDPWPLEASIPGVFVAGDARADSVKRVASAVGEGAMAVTLAHRYLGSP